MEIQSASIRTAINKISETYSNVSGDILRQATSRALNRSASSGRTEANKQIRKVYNIGASKINNELKVRYSQPRTLNAKIVASGSPISLSAFGASQELFASLNSEGKNDVRKGYTSFGKRGNVISRIGRKANLKAKKGVTAKIKKSGGNINLPTAFIQVSNGGVTVFARGRNKGSGEGFEFGKDRMPISKITSLSIPMMLANDSVVDSVNSRVLEVLNDRITHEINWLLTK